MVDADVLEKSCSPYSSPYLLVKKKNGTWRLVHNFIRLNSVTKKDRFPLPRIDDLLDHLLKKRFFSTFDLFSGFYQIMLHPDDREKTSFLTRHGSFQFKRMPMGISNAPSSFQRLMNMALGRLIGPSCLCYLDDIIVYGHNFQDHLQNLDKVFNAVRAANLRFQLSKCCLGYTSVKFLGVIVTPSGLRPDPDKVKTLKEMPNPNTVKQVRSFLGLASYYRRFIKDFATIASPLYTLTCLDVAFEWGPDQQEAKDTLIRALTSVPILVVFDPSKPVFLHCDASRVGLGCVMSHSPNSDYEVVGYFSRSLNKCERNYTATEIEMLAVIFSIKKTRHYIYQQHFTVVVDHHALCFLLGKKDTSGRLLRWQLYLQEYDFTITYKKGKTHCNADCLSRFPLPDTLPEGEDSDHDRTLALMTENISDTVTAQAQDEFCKRIFGLLQQSDPPDRVISNFVIQKGILYKVCRTEFGRKLVMCLPEKWFFDVLSELHDGLFGCHRGKAATMHRFKQRFYIPNVEQRIAKYIRSCDACQRRKPLTHRREDLLQALPTSDIPFDIVCVDFSGPLQLTPRNNRFVIVLIDVATRYVEAIATPNQTADTTAEFLKNDLIFRHGAPSVLISDRGTNFLSRAVKSLLYRLQTDKRNTTSYNPRCNGLVERQMKTYAEMMTAYVTSDPYNWDLLIPCVRFAMNTSPHEVTKKTPFELVHFRMPPTFLDLFVANRPGDFLTQQLGLINRVRAEACRRIQASQVQRTDQQREVEGFDVGDLVLVHKDQSTPGLARKFQVKEFGPYLVTNKFTAATYEVCRVGEMDQRETVNLRNMKPYFQREVEITGHRVRPSPQVVESPHEHSLVTNTSPKSLHSSPCPQSQTESPRPCQSLLPCMTSPSRRDTDYGSDDGEHASGSRRRGTAGEGGEHTHSSSGSSDELEAHGKGLEFRIQTFEDPSMTPRPQLRLENVRRPPRVDPAATVPKAAGSQSEPGHSEGDDRSDAPRESRSDAQHESEDSTNADSTSLDTEHDYEDTQPLLDAPPAQLHETSPSAHYRHQQAPRLFQPQAASTPFDDHSAHPLPVSHNDTLDTLIELQPQYMGTTPLGLHGLIAPASWRESQESSSPSTSTSAEYCSDETLITPALQPSAPPAPPSIGQHGQPPTADPPASAVPSAPLLAAPRLRPPNLRQHPASTVPFQIDPSKGPTG